MKPEQAAFSRRPPRAAPRAPPARGRRSTGSGSPGAGRDDDEVEARRVHAGARQGHARRGDRQVRGREARALERAAGADARPRHDPLIRGVEPCANSWFETSRSGTAKPAPSTAAPGIGARPRAWRARGRARRQRCGALRPRRRRCALPAALERHHQLDHGERVGTQVRDQVGLGPQLIRRNLQRTRHQIGQLLRDVFHGGTHVPSRSRGRNAARCRTTPESASRVPEGTLSEIQWRTKRRVRMTRRPDTLSFPARRRSATQRLTLAREPTTSSARSPA